jgi:hypothetical protein
MTILTEHTETIVAEVGDTSMLKYWYMKGGGTETDFLTDLGPFIETSWEDGYFAGNANGYDEGYDMGWIGGRNDAEEDELLA